VIRLVAITAALVLVLVLVTPALAKPPRPDCGRAHCKVTWVSYSYKQRAHDQYGNQYVSTCYMPAHGSRHCGVWRPAP
jgi:hypothetical protein